MPGLLGLPWQRPTLRKSTLANQLTMQATLEHLFLTKKWVKDATHKPGPACASVSHSETRRADLPPLVRSSGEMVADRTPQHTFLFGRGQAAG